MGKLEAEAAALEMQSPSPIDQQNTQSYNSPVKSPKSPFISRVITPIASPMVKKAMACIEEIGNLTKLDPQDAWLPITESRNGNAYYAAFHTLSSGLGLQALVLPLAFTTLGWIWGTICLSMAFVWQLYTLWLLIQLHESVPGTRYGRYLRLSMAAFGEKLGKAAALFPTMYLSGGTCVTLIMIGAGSMKIFFHIVCGGGGDALTTVEWYALFTVSAVILAQLPNLNSIAGVSLVGAISAVAYCTVTWALSIAKDRPSGITYGPEEVGSPIERVCGLLNALGIVAFAFRGHNLVLEIQSTMPSSMKHPSSIPMWRGVKASYVVISLSLFPLAIGGYWAYGNLMPTNGGILTALDKYHRQDTQKVILGIINLLVVIHSLTSFQIYAMPVFDNLEFRYTSKKKRPCPWWLRASLRLFFGALAYFIAVALPFLPSLAGLIGGIALPVTLAYPCLMWIMIKTPKMYTPMWFLNWFLGIVGLALSVLLVFGAIWMIATQGIEVHFFKPQ